MNKTRRMITVLAQRLNREGVAVVIPDLFGTGESEGEFSDASWSGWIEDLLDVEAWSREQGLRVVGILGVRTGAILAGATAACGLSPVSASVFWQPVRSGSIFVNQILRLRVISQSVNRGIRETVSALMDRIRKGEVVWVAGYPLRDEVIGPIVEAKLDSLVSPSLGAILMIDVGRSNVNDPDVSFDQKIVEASRVTFDGEPYWSSSETLCNESVIAHSVQHFLRHA